jgi:hypothetical protein
LAPSAASQASVTFWLPGVAVGSGAAGGTFAVVAEATSLSALSPVSLCALTT